MKLLYGMLLLLAGVGVLAEPDAGARAGLEHWPGAAVVETHAEERRDWHFVLGPLEADGAYVRAESERRVAGDLWRTTLEMPAGARPEEVAAFYREQLPRVDPDNGYHCDGAACGRSFHWANSLFEVRKLTGLDRHQHFQASLLADGSLLMLYVAQRGNRRVWVHLEHLIPAAGTSGLDANLLQLLTRQGWLRLPGVSPSANGDVRVAQALRERVARDLAPLAGRPVHVVCHIYGTERVAQLLATSQRCADAVVLALTEAAGERQPSYIGHGAGPLLPRAERGRDPRVELVVPHLLPAPPTTPAR